MAPGPPYSEVLFTDDIDRREASRAVARGRLLRLGPGIYSGSTGSDPADVVRRQLWRIVAHELPGAVISDRSVLDGGLGKDGYLYVVSNRARPLELPGVTVVPRPGAPGTELDLALPDGLYMSGEARCLLDNLVPTRSTRDGRSRTLSRAEVEDWVDRLCAARGAAGLNQLRDQARALAPRLHREKELTVLDTLVGAALATRPGPTPLSRHLRARVAGRPVDQRRLAAFERLAEHLADTSPDVVPDLPADADRRRLLPFYEAYFSNFIEGTQFTLDEAADIVFGQHVPEQRPQDAHDVLGTYQLSGDLGTMTRTPASGDELVDLLRVRHGILLGSRPDVGPGQLKLRPNQAGSTRFVDPALVEGTLVQGFAAGRRLVTPFARAVYMMFLVSEVHPFADGNGRLARIMMNAELVAGGEVRIVVPTVYRINYLAGLKAATHTGNDASLVATLAFARRWTARVDFSSRDAAEADLSRTQALRDAQEADEAGIRLRLP